MIILCGCLISLIGFGPRSAFGFFLTPMSAANGWGRDVFALAFALQNLLWGMGQPFAGAVADRFGMVRVLSVGALLYAAGLALMAYTTSPVTLQVTAGVLIGFGLSGCSFNLVIAAFGKLLDERYRMLAIGAGTAAGSFGQFLFAPFGVALIDGVGWQQALLVFGGMLLLIVPMALALATPRSEPKPAGGAALPATQSLMSALAEAFGHRSYVFLVLGFFTCGFQLAFITLHLPSYLIDRGLSAQIGGWTLATIGLFNIIGSISVGWLSNIYPRRYLLALNYFLRARLHRGLRAAAGEPRDHAAVRRRHGPAVALDRAADLEPGLASCSARAGSPRCMASCSSATRSAASSAPGLGGLLYERTGSYDIVWWLAVLFGVLSAVINLPIEEKPVLRAAPAAA